MDSSSKLVGVLLAIIFNYLWKISLFEQMDFGSQIIWCLSVGDLAFSLEQDASAVVVFIDKMNCDARFLFTRCNYSLVHRMPVHAFAAVFWQQCGMNIDYFVGVLL